MALSVILFAQASPQAYNSRYEVGSSIWPIFTVVISVCMKVQQSTLLICISVTQLYFLWKLHKHEMTKNILTRH